MSDDLDLTDRTVLVTGSGRNIGRACALEFAKSGANIVVNARSNADEAHAVVAEIESMGAHAVAALGDVGVPADVDGIVATAQRAFGGVDVYVSCASVRSQQPLLEVTDDDWGAVINANLSASFYLARRIAPGMVQRRWGRIIHIVGQGTFRGSGGRAAFGAAKLGVHGLTKAMAKELAPFGITVNSVVPGSIDTTRDLHDHGGEWNEQARIQAIPVGRIGDPFEVAWLCRFLASARSGYMTGQAFHANGGESMF